MEAIQQLKAHLASFQAPHGVCFHQLEIPAAPRCLISWLRGQSSYPQIYWSDKQPQCVAAIGASLVLETPVAVDNCLKQLAELSPDMRLYGGRAWDMTAPQWPGFAGNRFVLPRVEWRQQSAGTTVVCNLYDADGDLQRAARAMMRFLNELQPACPVRALPAMNRYRFDQPRFDQWQNLVEQVVGGTAQSPADKVVLARQTDLNADAMPHPLDLLSVWAGQSPHCFNFMTAFDATRSFLGCSPERLFQREHDQLVTEALAGTVPRGRNEAEDRALAWRLHVDDKIQRENKLVLEDILEQLDRVSTASGMEPAPAVLRLRTVQHLKHRIEALLKPGVTDMDLLNCLHPTPAVGGAPRQSALEFIRRQETFVRGWYAGALGYVSAHRSEFAVAIRSALIDERGLHLFAGAGIVRGSDPVEEWQELENKIRLPLSLLGFA